MDVNKWKLFSELVRLIENDKEILMLVDIDALWASSHKYTIEDLKDLILRMEDYNNND